MLLTLKTPSTFAFRFREIREHLVRKSEIEYDNWSDRRQAAEELREGLRPILADELKEEPHMSDDDLRDLVEELVNERL